MLLYNPVQHSIINLAVKLNLFPLSNILIFLPRKHLKTLDTRPRRIGTRNRQRIYLISLRDVDVQAAGGHKPDSVRHVMNAPAGNRV